MKNEINELREQNTELKNMLHGAAEIANRYAWLVGEVGMQGEGIATFTQDHVEMQCVRNWLEGYQKLTGGRLRTIEPFTMERSCNGKIIAEAISSGHLVRHDSDACAIIIKGNVTTLDQMECANEEVRNMAQLNSAKNANMQLRGENVHDSNVKCA